VYCYLNRFHIAVLVACFLNHFCGTSCAQIAQGQSRSRTDFASLSAKADAARDSNRLEEAIPLYRRAVALRPSWAEGWWSLATLEYDKDRYSEAATHFRKVVSLQPANGTAYAMLGLCEFELGRDQLALRNIEKGKNLGLQQNPELWNVVLFHEGSLLQRRGSFQSAQDTLEELCLRAGPNEKTAIILGMAMLRMSLHDAPQAGSQDYDVALRVGRAECLAGQKKYDQARPEFASIVNENAKSPNLHYAFGLFLFEIRDVAAGVEQMKQEIANNPKNVLARLRIAAAEYKQDSAAGLPYAQEAVKLDPQQPFAHMLLGLLRLDVDDYQGAIPELEIARKGLPTEPKIFAALGTAYARAGRKQDSVQARMTFARLTDAAKRKSAEASQPEARNPRSEQIRVGDLPPSSR